MASPELEDRTRKIIAKQLDIDEARVVRNAAFVDDLNIDSLKIVGLVMAVEEEFNIEIPDDITEKVLIVADLLYYLDAHSKD